MKKHSRPPAADSISVSRCKHGVWIRFHDRAGKVIAVANMPPDTALNVSCNIYEEWEALVGGTEVEGQTPQ